MNESLQFSMHRQSFDLSIFKQKIGWMTQLNYDLKFKICD